MKIGTDMVSIKRVESMIQSFDSFVEHTFTKREIEEAGHRPNPAEYLAARFAVKEAVYKALSHTCGNYDLRTTETLNHPDGTPYVVMSEELKRLLERGGFSVIEVSITTEGEYALAFVLVY